MLNADDILNELVSTMPYNNAEAVLEHRAGKRVRTFGGSCLHQLSALGERFHEHDVTLRFLGSMKSTHHTGFAAIDDEVCFFDPSMRQRERLSLTRLFSEGRPQRSRSYPHNDRLQCEICLEPTGDCTFRETIFTALQDNCNQHFLPGRIEEFDLRKECRLPNTAFDITTTLQQQKLLLVGVTEGGEVGRIQMDLSGKMKVQLLGMTPYREGAPDFDSIVERVLRNSGATPNMLKSYFNEAREHLVTLLASTCQTSARSVR